MKLRSEDDLLKKEVRMAIIAEVTGNENLGRKNEMLRRHEIYRDKNRKWVIHALAQEGYKETTLAQMQNRAANISVCRRIINKLARTYVGGVERKCEVASDQKTLDQLVKVLDFNTAQKKLDRFRQLFKNALIYFYPCKSAMEVRPDDGMPLWEIKAKAMAPWQYDAIEDMADPTRAMCYILTDFPEREQFITVNANYARGAQGYRDPGFSTSQGDGRDQIIADNPADKGKEKREFVFWSAKYHFTCDDKGEIIPLKSGENNLNPIQMMPFADVHEDQDGNYWAEGGDDVIEGSVLINKLLTDGNYIAFTQGWGQLVISAPEIPKKLQGGPDNAFIFETKPDTPEPKVYFATSNPNLMQWLESVRMHLAMLLTTNGLSPRSVSAKLDATTISSGIAMLIENSDVDEETKDTQSVFRAAEPVEWRIVTAWQTLYGERKLLIKDLAEVPPMKEPTKIALKFLQIAPPITEGEKLDAMKKRKEIGIATTKDLIKLDNPDLTDEQVDARMEELTEEKKANQAEMGLGQDDNPIQNQNKQEEPPNAEEEEDA